MNYCKLCSINIDLAESTELREGRLGLQYSEPCIFVVGDYGEEVITYMSESNLVGYVISHFCTKCNLVQQEQKKQEKRVAAFKKGLVPGNKLRRNILKNYPRKENSAPAASASKVHNANTKIQDASVLSVLDIPVDLRNYELQLQYNSEDSVLEGDEFLQSLMGATLEHTTSQTDIAPIINVECQTEEECCQYCKENNSMLWEIMRHIKWSVNPLNSASLPPETSMDTPSTLGIIFSSGMMANVLVSAVCVEAETIFDPTVQTTVATAARIDTLDRNNGNGSAELEPLLLSDFTQQGDPTPSTSSGESLFYTIHKQNHIWLLICTCSLAASLPNTSPTLLP
nr:PREDICTED: putative homeodomain transcription factor 2 isoform X3 [Latimeria chalumnae]|eukprot:XP_014348857.1 PREDICTED: putative homeodomain transcription factor 2 isoform X3 [Latimeria chalumnae]